MEGQKPVQLGPQKRTSERARSVTRRVSFWASRCHPPCLIPSLYPRNRLPEGPALTTSKNVKRTFLCVFCSFLFSIIPSFLLSFFCCPCGFTDVFSIMRMASAAKSFAVRVFRLVPASSPDAVLQCPRQGVGRFVEADPAIPFRKDTLRSDCCLALRFRQNIAVEVYSNHVQQRYFLFLISITSKIVRKGNGGHHARITKQPSFNI